MNPLLPGTLLTYRATGVGGRDNPWNGKVAMVIEKPLSDVLDSHSVLHVIIDGIIQLVGACYFEELVEFYGWRLGV